MYDTVQRKLIKGELTMAELTQQEAQQIDQLKVMICLIFSKMKIDARIGLLALLELSCYTISEGIKEDKTIEQTLEEIYTGFMKPMCNNFYEERLKNKDVNQKLKHIPINIVQDAVAEMHGVKVKIRQITEEEDSFKSH